MISQLLTELDGLEILTNVVVIAATNRPDIIDPALLRPGRFDRLLYVSQPDRESRLQILKIHTKSKPLSEDVSLEQLADLSEGYTGADISSMSSERLCSLCVNISLNIQIQTKQRNMLKSLKLHLQEFEEAMKKIRPLSSQELTMYKRISEEFGKPEIGVKRRGSKDADLTAGGIT